MKLSTLVVFGAGYVMGTKAGRERYAEIVNMAQKISRRLDELGARVEEREGSDAGHAEPEDAYAEDLGGDFDAWEDETAVGGSGLEGLGGRSFAGHPAADLGRDRPRRAG